MDANGSVAAIVAALVAAATGNAQAAPTGEATVSAGHDDGAVAALARPAAAALAQDTLDAPARQEVAAANRNMTAADLPPSAAAVRLPQRNAAALAAAPEGNAVERLPATAATTVSAAVASASASGAAGESATLKLPNGEASQWRQPLAQALGERLEVQLARGSERAVIRLDPPMMGTVEIVVRHEGGALQVHLSATHGDVLRQLHALSDSLRQDPALRQFSEVSVQVSDAGRDGDGRQRQRQAEGNAEEPGRALAEAEAGHAPQGFSLSGEQG
ncbi:hypothetical protein GRF61_09130 [Azoarcus sp. TTM-91]|nr:hypothetical protein [Azoarcus sp. TTM-91]